jgi:hypothetical protein
MGFFPLKDLALELGVPESNPLAVEQHGRAFTVKYMAGGKNTPPSLHVTAIVDETNDVISFGAYREQGRPRVDTRPAIVLRRETGMDRFGKRVGLNRELEVGDAAFDAAVYIETDAPDEDVERTLADDRLRTAVRDMLASGVTRIDLDPKGLSAVLRGASNGRPTGAELLRSTEQLARAAAALPLFKTGQASKPRSLLGSMVPFIFALMAAPMLLGLSANKTLDKGPALLGLSGGLAFWVLAEAMLWVTLRGKSDGLRRFVLLSFTALFVLPTGLFAGLVWTNRWLDASPGADHTTTVTRVWTSRGKNTTYFHVDVASWRPGESTLTLNVSQGFSSTLKAGSKMVVTTHAGELGWEWVDGFRAGR